MVEVMRPIIPIEVTVIEAVEATKSIIAIEVAIVETVKAKCGVSHWSVSHRHRCPGPEHRSALHRHPRHRTWHESAAHSHPGHRITVPSHLRRRSRGYKDACYHVTKENEFFPVHSVIGFKKLNPSGFESIAFAALERLRRCYHSDAAPTGDRLYMMRRGRIPNYRFGRTCTKRASSHVAWL
jgi:hypothetical protein